MFRLLYIVYRLSFQFFFSLSRFIVTFYHVSHIRRHCKSIISEVKTAVFLIFRDSFWSLLLLILNLWLCVFVRVCTIVCVYVYVYDGIR